ncbi:unnamed protein product [Clonostachys rosea f. rosea IK726]|nr:unnamed protein product [Clonostachys rosea f. rosea IK726]
MFISNGVTKRQMYQDRWELKKMATLHAQHDGLIVMFPTKDNDLGIKSDTYFKYPSKINFELVFLDRLSKLDVRRWCAIGKAVLDHLMPGRVDGTKESSAEKGVTEKRSTNELAICNQKVNLGLPIDDIVKKLATDESIRCNCTDSGN